MHERATKKFLVGGFWAFWYLSGTGARLLFMKPGEFERTATFTVVVLAILLLNWLTWESASASERKRLRARPDTSVDACRDSVTRNEGMLFTAVALATPSLTVSAVATRRIEWVKVRRGTLLIGKWLLGLAEKVITIVLARLATG